MKVRWRVMAMVVTLSAAVLTVQAAGALQFRLLYARDVPMLLQAPHMYPFIAKIWSSNCSYRRENIVRTAQ